jgi:hypothetical protein
MSNNGPRRKVVCQISFGTSMDKARIKLKPTGTDILIIANAITHYDKAA